jgi:hypothetical protein
MIDQEKKDLERKMQAELNALVWRLNSLALTMELLINLPHIMREWRN